jgi:heptosyltransferase-2
VLSSDSLAMHFAIALQKRVLAFFGPTSAAEIELYGRGEKLVAPIACGGCYKKQCDIKPNCMEKLSVAVVFDSVKRQLTASQ